MKKKELIIIASKARSGSEEIEYPENDIIKK